MPINKCLKNEIYSKLSIEHHRNNSHMQDLLMNTKILGESVSRNGTFMQSLHQFPVAAVMNYYKFSGLKQHKVILFRFWRPEVQSQLPQGQNQGAAESCSLRKTWGRIGGLALSGAVFFSSWPLPFSILKASNMAPSNLSLLPPSHCLVFCRKSPS